MPSSFSFSAHIAFRIRTNRDIVASTLEDEREYDSSSDLGPRDPRTREQRLEGVLHANYLKEIVQRESEALEARKAEVMNNDDTEDPSEFDFDFDTAYFYGHNKEWLLYQVYDFLKGHADVCGVRFDELIEELHRNTSLKVGLTELGKFLQPVVIS
jgi:hypothetical protein